MTITLMGTAIINSKTELDESNLAQVWLVGGDEVKVTLPIEIVEDFMGYCPIGGKWAFGLDQNQRFSTGDEKWKRLIKILDDIGFAETREDAEARLAAKKTDIEACDGFQAWAQPVEV